jgi:glycosyltransferase involved in cell wall biosynthesis
MPKPLVSVVIPLPDHREQTFACLASFLNQTLAEGEVEVIVSCDGSHPQLAAEIASEFAQVRLLQRPGAEFMSLYNEAAAVAQGKYIFITEMHCVAEPDCLAAAIRHVEQGQLTCACVNSRGINANRFAACEQRILEEDLPRWLNADQGKISIRGFLLPREVWQQVGGFQRQYYHFAEVMMGRKLNALGCKIGYVQAGLVNHYNQAEIYHLTEELTDYGYGEAYCSHVESSSEATLTCYELEKQQRKGTTRPKLHWRRVTNLARLHWYRMLMKLLPLSEESFYRLYVKHWEISIRIGRYNYLLSDQYQRVAKQAAALAIAPRLQRQAA